MCICVYIYCTSAILAQAIHAQALLIHGPYCSFSVLMVDLIANGWELPDSSDDDNPGDSDVERPRGRPAGIFGCKLARRIRDRIVQQHNMMPQHTGAAQHTGASQCEERLNKK